MEFALVIVTAIYVGFMGWLVWINQRQFAMQSDPVACALPIAADVRFGPDGAFLDLKVSLSAIGGRPAVNVSVVVDLQLFPTPATQGANVHYQWPTRPVLAVGEARVNEVQLPTSVLGQAGPDSIEVPLLLSVETSYSDTTGRNYVGIFVNSPISTRAPENAGASRGVAIGEGVFHHPALPHSRIGRWRLARKRRRLSRQS